MLASKARPLLKGVRTRSADERPSLEGTLSPLRLGSNEGSVAIFHPGKLQITGHRKWRNVNDDKRRTQYTWTS